MKASVSIVLCTYNGAKYLSEQLDSILAQTYPLHEIIIQDDNSTDETVDIIHEYARKYSFIKFFKNNSEHGVNGNFLSAMQRATGDYIAISDQDDIWETDKIENQMNSIGKNLLCSGFSCPFSTDGSFAYFDHRKRNVNVVRMCFLGLPGHTLLFRRELVNMLPPLEHSIYKYSMYDAALSITAAAHKSIVFIDKILVNFRRHSAATTYNDYKKSLPSWQNALYMLWWGIMHFKETRKRIRPIFAAKLLLLNYVNANNDEAKAAKTILELELQNGVLPFLKLQYQCMKNYKYLFHTEGKGFLRFIRAALYPIMQLQMYAQ
ncbi:glycosyltransferase [Prevotella nigrescens]|jgi:glycosyltransferase, group 2 family protein|uniref:glycosyltransferase n=1 Tax=Prevotella nigrescens TaxID=28133 RepID=UPI002431BE52|nr:glycosyltransferase [Prevotella nigrescens]